MKKIIVPLMSVGFYFLIYGIIVLLKPPQNDSIRSMYLSTHSLVQQLANIIHFHTIPFENVQQQRVQHNVTFAQELENETFRHEQASFINQVSPSRFKWKIFQSQKILENQVSEGSLQKNTSYLQLYNNKFPCFPLKQIKLGVIEKSISEKIGLINKQYRQETLYRILDGINTHFKLLSSKFTQNKPQVQSSLQEIFEKEQFGNNLLFLYESTAYTIKKVLQSNNISVSSQSFQADLIASRILSNLKTKLQNSTFDSYKSYWRTLFRKEQILSQFQKLSRIFESNQNRECSIIKKSHIKALGHVITYQILQKETKNLDQFIELAIFFDAITSSVQIYYKQKKEAVRPQHMKSWFDNTQVYFFVFGLGLVTIYIFSQINIDKKVKKQFRHAFPPGNKFKFSQ